MLLTGIAIQIKYTAVFEGIFFGLSLVWVGWKAGRPFGRLAFDAIVWMACALAPTLAVLALYLATGHGQEFIQANFLSVLSDSNPLLPALGRLAALVGGLSPLGICGWIAWRRRPVGPGPARREVLWLFAWVGASFAGFLLLGVWNDHYVLPLLPPLCLAVAFGFGKLGDRRWIAVAAVLGLGLAGGLARSVVDVRINGNERQIAQLTAMIEPHLARGCLYVNEDLSILYYLTRSCLPTRYVFPQHLALSRYEHALGVDQMVELRRMLAQRPAVIVLSKDPDYETRFATRRVVEAQLRSNYDFVGASVVGETRYAVFAAVPLSRTRRGESTSPSEVPSARGGPNSAGSKISAQIRVHTSEIMRINPMLAVPG
jgi:hypothetical protein